MWMVFLLAISGVSCSSDLPQNEIKSFEVLDTIKEKTQIGAELMEEYLPLLQGKRVAIVGNQTSVLDSIFLLDTLLSLGVDLRILFAPEHGFRGDHHAGAKVKHSVDSKTGLRIFSLHGKTKKPSRESLDSVDVILFDIQDVGVRFYTYLSTLHYVLEAAAEYGKKVIILDRPNPNAHYIDGPVLQPEYKSFLGLHPVPVVYGMTIGEYGTMINGEFWLKDSLQADLQIIKLKNWNYNKEYILPIAPSPNLPNQLSIYLYPSLCFFEGTEVSIGRGTKFPFQVWGHPGAKCELLDHFSFKPISIAGKSKYPKHENVVCRGIDFRSYSKDSIRKHWKLELIPIKEAQVCTNPNEEFFNRSSFFNLLAGNNTLIQQLKKGITEQEIRVSWTKQLEKFKVTRAKYLLYQ
jgi:uncharacterized protein YbbC (DUF1343 family)